MSGEVIEGEAVEEVASNLPAVRAHEAVVVRDEITVGELIAQRSKIVDAMQQAMVKDVHYGTIPGVNKPTLLKPGAELLNVLFRLAPSYQRERTWHDDGHLTVESNCTLTHIPSGLVIASGGGLCSTQEQKYAYRQGGRTCPECGQQSIIKGKAEFGGGWLCFKKKGGCGAKFADGTEPAREFETAEVGRVLNDDLPDSYNTVLKMADKRALVAAVLNGTAASDVFTQDAEEMPAAEPVTVAVDKPPADPFTVMHPSFKDAAAIAEALNHLDPSVDWRTIWASATALVYGAEPTKAQRQESVARMSHVAAALTEGGDFPPPDDMVIQVAFARAFGGVEVPVERHELPGADDPIQAEAEQIPFGTEG